MRTPSHDLRPSPTAQRVADGLRSGVSARLRPFEAAAPDEDLARLRQAGDLDSLPPGAKPGTLGPAVRTARRVLRMLLRPWTGAQTAFNREIAGQAIETAQAVHAVERRLEQLESSLQALEQRLMILETERQDASDR